MRVQWLNTKDKKSSYSRSLDEMLARNPPKLTDETLAGNPQKLLDAAVEGMYHSGK